MKTQQLTLAMAEGIYVFYCFQNINVVDCYSVNFSKITANTTQHNTTQQHPAMEQLPELGTAGRGGKERLSIGRASTNQSPLRMRNRSASRLPLRFGPV